MTVKQLIAHLLTFDPDALVVNTRYSDVASFDASEVTAGRAIVRRGEYVNQGWHVFLTEKDEATMDPALKPFVRNVVHFEGN